MTSLPGQSAKVRYSQLPASVSFSDHLQPLDVIAWAYADCFKSDFKKIDGTGIKWPVIKVSKMAADLGVSKTVLNKSLARLRAAGFLRTEQTQTGNRMILSARASIEDTLKGREYREKDFTKIGIDLITSEFAAIKLLVLIFIDRFKQGNPTAYTTEKEIAKFVGRAHRTVGDYVAELKHHGLLDLREREDRIGYFEYWIILDAPLGSASSGGSTKAASEIKMGGYGKLPTPYSYEYMSLCLDLLDLWVVGVTGKPRPRYDLLDFYPTDPELVAEDEAVNDAMAVIEEALLSTEDPDLVRQRLEDGLQTYGLGYPVEFITKVLDFSDPDPEHDPFSDAEFDAILAASDSRNH
ncbi:hypothetical protein [Streptosporangium sp. 'caverna']|uniref:hypothetical protein n=1 Tax=Streptosporangium sp. 'caverna' TaxID=2202249 RepID=UPI000D7D6393|nr:hypothetical protein [Streptosporangium sp. 'caverna']AWS44529.1 hypothetical protein DKM19_27445 [Streptosporangium sp. 'caverna']